MVHIEDSNGASNQHEEKDEHLESDFSLLLKREYSFLAIWADYCHSGCWISLLCLLLLHLLNRLFLYHLLLFNSLLLWLEFADDSVKEGWSLGNSHLIRAIIGDLN